MAPGALAQVLRPLREVFDGVDDDDLLVGLEAPDDAAVYRLDDDDALVVTVDFFTPIVDDPRTYGAIAAANSLSDLYAMGAQPLLALNVAALPASLPLEIGAEIFRGGAEKAREAGIPLVGGHTVRDDEPKYGLVAVGRVDPRSVTRKGGARPGDRLLLSKPLGAGVVTTALMRDLATAAEIEAATTSMTRLNRDAAAVAIEAGATAVTDVTGFGLIGHASEMAAAGSVGFAVRFDALTWLAGAERLAREERAFPGGAFDNREFYGPRVRIAPGLDEWQSLLAFSPETSGGLLMALPPKAVPRAMARASELELPLVEIGEVVGGEGIALIV